MRIKSKNGFESFQIAKNNVSVARRETAGFFVLYSPIQND